MMPIHTNMKNMELHLAVVVTATVGSAYTVQELVGNTVRKLDRC